MKRNRYTQEFKHQIVQEAAEVGNTAQVARRHDLNLKMVYQWVSSPNIAIGRLRPPEQKKWQLTRQLRKSFVQSRRRTTRLSDFLAKKTWKSKSCVNL